MSENSNGKVHDRFGFRETRFYRAPDFVVLNAATAKPPKCNKTGGLDSYFEILGWIETL